MGYYFLIATPVESFTPPPTYEELMEYLRAEPWCEEVTPGDDSHYAEPFFFYGRGTIDIEEVPPHSRAFQAPWLSIRASWGTREEEFYKLTALLLTLSEDLGMNLYSDGGERITKDDLLAIAMEFTESSGNIVGMIGCIQGQVSSGGYERTRRPLISVGTASPTSAMLEEDPPLVHACRDGDLNRVEELIAADADANKPGLFGETALLWALRQKNRKVTSEIVRRLVQAGAAVNVADKYGESVLNAACRLEDCDLMLLILRAGADPNFHPPFSSSPLMTAAYNDNMSLVALLLEYGADPNAACGRRQMTPLMRSRKAAMTSMLLKAGARTSDRTSTGTTALMIAAMRTSPESLQLLLNVGADVNERDDKGQTALVYAVQCGKTESVRVLIGAGIDQLARDSDGKTALDYADPDDAEMRALLRCDPI